MSHKLTLLSLQAMNFGRHEELELSFSKNLTVIKGPNGAGKSTALQAIYFAFFGVSAVDGKAADIPRHGTKSVEVELMFKLGEVDYCIRRTLKEATVLKYIAPDDPQDDIVATGNSTVNDWVERNLGVSQKVFMQLTYSAQTETAAIMSIGAASLNRMVEQIAEADFISQVEKKASEFSLTAEMGLSSMEKPDDIGELSIKHEAAKVVQTVSGAALKISDEQLNSHNLRLAEHRVALAAAKKTHDEIQAWKPKIAEADNGIAAQTALVDKALLDIAAANGSEDALAKAREWRDDRANNVKKWREILQTKETNLARQHQLQTYLDETESRRAEHARLTPLITIAHGQLETATANRDAANAEVKEIEEEIRRVQHAIDNAVCNACNRPFDEVALAAAKQEIATHNDLWAHRKTMQSERQRLFDEARNAYHALQNKLPQFIAAVYEDRKDELVRLKMKYPNVEITHDQVKAMEAELTAAAEKVAEAKSALAAREKSENEHKAASERLDRYKRAKQAALDKLAEFGEIDIAAVQEHHSILLEAQSSAQVQYSKDKASHDRASLEVAAFGKAIEKAERLMNERSLLERRKVSFSGLTKYVRENRETFMAELWDQLMALTSDFIAGVTDGKISAIMRGESGDFVYVENDDGEQHAYARLAGGFKAVAGVGLRIALASLLPAGVSLVVLDEPSSELRDDVAAALAAALRATDRQIILVTHRVGEEYASDQVIELGA